MNGLRIRLEELIQGRHLLETSFYKRWTAGNVTREELQGYAKEYYQFEKEFPRFISAVHSKCDDLQMRQMLLENLIDEERGEQNHPELWMRFAEGLGVRREELQNHFHSDETEHLLRSFRDATSSAHVVDGLAALYAYERQQPEVVRQKIDGLKRYYGISDERSVDFFRVHQVADVHHAETEISLLERLCDDEEMKERAVLVVQRTLDTLYDFLDGVERRYRPAA